MIRTDIIQITSEILSLITRIDEFKGAWRALGRLAPDRLSALRHVATIESIGSSTLLLQAGYAYVPYSSLESVVEQNKEAYYLALRQTRGTIRTDILDWQPWLVFFLKSLVGQVERLEKKIERENSGLASLPELSMQIVEFAREHGRITMGDAAKLTGTSRNTLKRHFRNLVKNEYLNQQGSGRGGWYELRWPTNPAIGSFQLLTHST